MPSVTLLVGHDGSNTLQGTAGDDLVLCPRNDRRFLFPASGRSATGFDLLKRVATADVFSENGVNARGPHEGFRLLVPRFEKLSYGALQIFNATE